jgi:putative intracellular protease/amidase
MDLEGKRVAILVEDNYEALEVWYPNLRIHEAGAEVTIVGPQAQAICQATVFPCKRRSVRITASSLKRIRQPICQPSAA